MPDFQSRPRGRQPRRPLPEPLRRPGRQNLQDLRGNEARQQDLEQQQAPATQAGPAAETEPQGSGELQQVMAIDISHWSGEPSQDDVEAWQAAGVEHAIVGTQREETTRAQLEILQANGISTDAYVYLYFTSDMTAQVVTAFERIEGYACGVLWLDVEDKGSASGFTTDELIAMVQEAVEAAETEIARLGLEMEVGIYTSWGFWTDVMENSTAFSDLPLWYAHWDHEADFDDWEDLPFGGWEEAMIRGKQYEGDTYIDGASPIVDLNTMLVPGASAEQEPAQEQAAVDQDQLFARLDGLISGGAVRLAS